MADTPCIDERDALGAQVSRLGCEVSRLLELTAGLGKTVNVLAQERDMAVFRCGQAEARTRTVEKEVSRLNQLSARYPDGRVVVEQLRAEIERLTTDVARMTRNNTETVDHIEKIVADYGQVVSRHLDAENRADTAEKAMQEHLAGLRSALLEWEKRVETTGMAQLLRELWGLPGVRP